MYGAYRHLPTILQIIVESGPPDPLRQNNPSWGKAAIITICVLVSFCVSFVSPVLLFAFMGLLFLRRS